MNRIATYNNYLKIFALLFIIFHIVRICNGLLISSLAEPFIHVPRQDPVVWNLIYSGVPDLIVKSRVLSMLLDVLVILPSILILFVLQKRKDWIRPALLVQLFLFSFYLLVIFSYPSLSIRKYLGLALVPIAFLAGNEKQYLRNLKWLRFFVLFIFSSSASWKILRGAMFDDAQFYNIMRAQHFEHIVNFPGHISSISGQFFINHPDVGYIFYFLIAIIQLSFIIGFFTRKYDRIILLLFLLFIIGDFIVMRIEYWEFFVFIPLFFSGKKKDQSGLYAENSI